MPRPKKKQPNRSDGRYEIKITLGKDINGKPIRKSFYSDISKDDASEKAEAYKLERKIADITGKGYVDRNVTFKEWSETWLKK